MKKKLLSILLICLVCLTSSYPVFAAPAPAVKKTIKYKDTAKYEKQVYVGQVVNGKREGTGTFTYKVKASAGLKDEYGTYKYVGAWHNDKQNGKGVLTNDNGYKYVGQFKNGVQEGNGTLTGKSPDGNGTFKYVGQFKNGKMNGKGTYTDKKGTQTGTWANGIKKAEQSNATVDLTKFVGQYNLSINGQTMPFNVMLTADGSLSAGFAAAGMQPGILTLNEGSTDTFTDKVPGSDETCTIVIKADGTLTFITPGGTFEGKKK